MEEAGMMHPGARQKKQIEQNEHLQKSAHLPAANEEFKVSYFISVHVKKILFLIQTPKLHP